MNEEAESNVNDIKVVNNNLPNRHIYICNSKYKVALNVQIPVKFCLVDKMIFLYFAMRDFFMEKL